MINNKCYSDLVEKYRNVEPELQKNTNTGCKELYGDLADVYFNKNLPNGQELILKAYNTKEIKATIRENGRDIYLMRFGADYMAPCIQGALCKGVEAGYIRKYLKATSIFGGYLIWPRRNGSIKQCRSTKRGFHDRIDLTLMDLKQWYSTGGQSKSCKLQSAFNRASAWLNCFSTFNKFMDFFKLNDFVDDDYNVWDLSTYKKDCGGFKTLQDDYIQKNEYPDDYKRFILGSTVVIKKRNRRFVNAT